MCQSIGWDLWNVSATRLRPIGVSIGRVKPYYQSNIGLVAVGEQQNGVQVHIFCTLETIGIVFEDTLLSAFIQELIAY